MRKRYGRVRLEDLEDAASVGVLHVIDYWVERYATDDTKRNWDVALHFAVNRATESLMRQMDQRNRTTSLDHLIDDDEGNFEPVDPDPTPEEEVVGETSSLRGAWSRLTHADRAVLTPLAHGESARCQAAREGRAPSNVDRDRRKAVGRLRVLCVEAGL